MTRSGYLKIGGVVLLVVSNMKCNVEAEPITDALCTGNYQEQVTWRAAAADGHVAAPGKVF